MDAVEYPRWLHHRTLEPVIARNADEGRMLLSTGWALQPSAFVGCAPEEGVPSQPPIDIEITKKKGGRPRKVK